MDTDHDSGEPSGAEHAPLADEAHALIDAVEARVLGCLVEKERTTPDDYPLTANALMRAANQSTSRNPVVSYDTRTVEAACATLKAKGLVRFVHMPSGRATTKYRQVLGEAWSVDGAELAVLALLMLRGAQTPGELKARSDRLHGFADLSAVTATLESLADRAPAMVREVGRAPGQKEARWAHLLCGEPDVGVDDAAPSPRRGRPDDGVGERLDRIEADLSELRTWVVELREALGLAVTPPE